MDQESRRKADGDIMSHEAQFFDYGFCSKEIYPGAGGQDDHSEAAAGRQEKYQEGNGGGQEEENHCQTAEEDPDRARQTIGAKVARQKKKP